MRGHLFSVSSYSQCCRAAVSPGPFGFLNQRRWLETVELPAQEPDWRNSAVPYMAWDVEGASGVSKSR